MFIKILKNLKVDLLIHMHNTRNKKDLETPFCRVKVSSNSPDVLGPRLYNRLPDNIKCIKNISLFKTKLKLYLVEKCFYDINSF